MVSQTSVSADGKESVTWDGLSPTSLTLMHSLTNQQVFIQAEHELTVKKHTAQLTFTQWTQNQCRYSVITIDLTQ